MSIELCRQTNGSYAPHIVQMGLDIAGTSPSKEPSKAPVSAQDGNSQVNRRPEDTQAWQGKVLRNRVVPPAEQSVSGADKIHMGDNRSAADKQRELGTHSQTSTGADMASENRVGVEKKRSNSFTTQTAFNPDSTQPLCQHLTNFLAPATMEGHGMSTETPAQKTEVPETTVQAPRVPVLGQPGMVDLVALIRRMETLERWAIRQQEKSQKTGITQQAISAAGQVDNVLHLFQISNRPPKFNGRRPREWLDQMEQYHETVGIPESMRVRDVFNYLEGPALSHFCLARRNGREPKTWEDFCRFVTQRFCHQSVAATVSRLYAIQWDGSLDSLVERFASVLEEGNPPSEEELVDIFIGRIPWSVLDILDSLDYPTWMDLSEALRLAMAPKEKARGRWLRTADPRLLQRETEEPSRNWDAPKRFIDRRKPPPTSFESGKNRREEVGCYTCGGSGHRARICPTINEQTKKEGAICNKCGGKNHWARDCTTRLTRVLQEVQRNKKNSDWGSARNDKQSFPGLGNDQA